MLDERIHEKLVHFVLFRKKKIRKKYASRCMLREKSVSPLRRSR